MCNEHQIKKIYKKPDTENTNQDHLDFLYLLDLLDLTEQQKKSLLIYSRMRAVIMKPRGKGFFILSPKTVYLKDVKLMHFLSLVQKNNKK